MRRDQISLALQHCEASADRHVLQNGHKRHIFAERSAFTISLFSRRGLTLGDQDTDQRGPSRMIVAPMTHNATPIQSEVNGRTRSITASQAIDAMM